MFAYLLGPLNPNSKREVGGEVLNRIIISNSPSKEHNLESISVSTIDFRRIKRKLPIDYPYLF